MKEIFNINRFSALWIKANRENLRANLVLLAVIAVVTFLCLCRFNPFTPEYTVVNSDGAKISFVREQAERQFIVFWSVLFFFSIVVAARSFKNVMSPYKSVNTLLLPASSFEKYLLAFLNSTVVFFLVYLLLFYGLDWLVNTYKYSAISQASYTTGWFGMKIPLIEEGQQMLRPSLTNVLNISSGNSGFLAVVNRDDFSCSYHTSFSFYPILGCWLYVIALFMWGSVTFRKRVILLTTLLHLLLFLVMGYFMYLIVGHVIEACYLSSMVDVQPDLPSPYWGLAFYLFPLTYLWVVWIKLKTKQLK